MHGIVPEHSPLVAYAGENLPAGQLQYTVSVQVVNEGETVEYVTFVSLTEGPHDQWNGLGLRIYGSEDGIDDDAAYELKLRERLRIPVALDREQLAWMQRGFIAEVWLGSGAHVHSGIEYLVDDLLEDIDGSSTRPGPSGS